MGNPFVTIIALDRATRPAWADVADAVGQLFPDSGIKVSILAGDPGRDDVVWFQVNDFKLTAEFIPAPLPAGTFDFAIAGAQLWDDARRMNDHVAHVVVSALNPYDDHMGALTAATWSMFVSAAIVSLTPATIGVHWAAGETVTEASAFITAAQDHLQGQPPVGEWIRYQWVSLERDGHTCLGCMTTGLLPFVGRELEFRPARARPADIIRPLMSAAAILIMKGPVLGDGDTIGRSETEKLAIRHKDEGWRAGIKVISIGFDAVEPVEPSGAC